MPNHSCLTHSHNSTQESILDLSSSPRHLPLPMRTQALNTHRHPAQPPPRAACVSRYCCSLNTIPPVVGLPVALAAQRTVVWCGLSGYSLSTRFDFIPSAGEFVKGPGCAAHISPWVPGFIIVPITGDKWAVIAPHQ